MYRDDEVLAMDAMVAIGCVEWTSRRFDEMSATKRK